MAYFLKRSNNKKGTYLQIYESFYDPSRGHTAHKSVKPIGYVHELEASGIADPVAHFKAEVDAMNKKRKEEEAADKTRRIGAETPERQLGHFPFKAINDALGCAKDISYLQLGTDFRFPLPDLLSSLVYARMVAPCSKSRTFHEVLPRLGAGTTPPFSLDQLYDGLAFLGAEHQKVIEIYNARIAKHLSRNTEKLYFDATNFYFEIDREDILRAKGPSKENRKDPIVGLGLLLDADLIPLGMKVFAGNESEKPVMREVIGSLRKRTGASGRVIRVADKGLNCADNIADAVLAGDGYLFSKSVKQLPELERAWVLDAKDWVDVHDAKGNVAYRTKSCVSEFMYKVTGKDGKRKSAPFEEKRVATFNPALCKKQRAEIGRMAEKARRLRLAGAKKGQYGESAKFVQFEAIDEDGVVDDDAKVAVTLDHAAIERAYAMAGYNMLVTSETKMPDGEVYATYHELWRIEESFRVMKSELDARPVFLQKAETITGHFLICYLAVLLLRIVQFKVLDGKYSSSELMRFAREFRVVENSERRYVNISRETPLLLELEQMTGLPLGNYHLGKKDVMDILNCKMNIPSEKTSA